VDALAPPTLSGSLDRLAQFPALTPCVEIYLTSCAKKGKPPTRATLDPAAFGSHLSCVLLLEHHPDPESQEHLIQPPDRIRIRLSGSKVNALFERELTGCFLEEVVLDEQGSTDGTAHEYSRHNQVRHRRIAGFERRPEPNISSHTIRLSDGRIATFERLAMPLAPLPGEPPMSVVVMLQISLVLADGSVRSLDQIRSPLWVNR
jgi:hypothetical protein